MLLLESQVQRYRGFVDHGIDRDHEGFKNIHELRAEAVFLRAWAYRVLAGMFGFEKKSKFEAEAGSEKAPEVKF